MTSNSKLPLFFAIFLAASTFTFAVQPDRIAGPIDSGNKVVLADHVSPMALSSVDRGMVAPSQQMRVTMLITPTAAQQQSMKRLAAEQQDKHSLNYHKWLTPESYAERFGLSPNDISKISSWLKAQGFSITYTARGRDSISFSGTADLIEKTFQTEIHQFDSKGKPHFANITSPMVPAALSGIVGSMRGLHNYFPQPMIRPMPHFTDSNFSTHFLAPGDIAKIYNINPLYTSSIDGTGQSMVVVGQTDVFLADLNDFRAGFGLSSITGCTTSGTGQITACNASNFQLVIPTTGGDPGINPGDLGESDLDIEWSGSVARKAKIIFVTSGGGVNDSASWAIDNNLAPVISMSYGLCEAFVTAPFIASQETELQKAATLGISFFASSGDAAAATCDQVTGNSTAQLGLSVSYPASSPSVTAVGGTEFNEGAGDFWNTTNGSDGGSAKSYIPELAWNDTVIAGGPDGTGGGVSNCAFGTGTTSVRVGTQNFAFELCKPSPNGGFPKPAYQTGVTLSDSVRDVPDISFSASNANDPYIVCAPQSEVGGSGNTSSCVNGIKRALDDFVSAFGGTSASAPVMAGVAVLMNQFLGIGRLGNMNPQLYALNASNPEAFHDIVAGFNNNTENSSDNIVACTVGTPTFEPSNVQCPGSGEMGFTAGVGYDVVTGLGSLDVKAFADAWAGSLTGFSLQATPNAVGVVAGHSVDSSIALTPENGFSAAVTYTCTGTGVTCTFTPSGATTTTPVVAHIQTTPNMATGSVPVTVKGTAGSVSATTVVTLTVSATDQSFAIGPSDASITVTQGSPGNTPLTVTPANGFSAAVTYTCTKPSTLTEATCSITPSGGTSATTITVNVTTTAAHAQLQNHNRQIWYAALLPGLMGIFLAAGSKRTPRKLRMLGLMMVLGMSTLWMVACGGSNNSGGGGGGGDAGTPKGMYTLTISGTTGGTNPVTATTTVALTVN